MQKLIETLISYPPITCTFATDSPAALLPSISFEYPHFSIPDICNRLSPTSFPSTQLNKQHH